MATQPSNAISAPSAPQDKTAEDATTMPVGATVDQEKKLGKQEVLLCYIVAFFIINHHAQVFFIFFLRFVPRFTFPNSTKLIICPIVKFLARMFKSTYWLKVILSMTELQQVDAV